MDVLPDEVGRRVRGTLRRIGRLRDEVDRDLPERLVLAGVSALKQRSRNRDLIGEAAHQALRLLNQNLIPKVEPPSDPK